MLWALLARTCLSRVCKILRGVCPIDTLHKADLSSCGPQPSTLAILCRLTLHGLWFHKSDISEVHSEKVLGKAPLAFLSSPGPGSNFRPRLFSLSGAPFFFLGARFSRLRGTPLVSLRQTPGSVYQRRNQPRACGWHGDCGRCSMCRLQPCCAFHVARSCCYGLKQYFSG